MTLAALSRADQVALILTASPAAIAAAWGKLRRSKGGGTKPNPMTPRCPICPSLAGDTLHTMSKRRKCRKCGTSYTAAIDQLLAATLRPVGLPDKK